SGTTVHDESNNKADGTLQGAPTWVTHNGRMGVLFDDPGDYISVDHALNLASNNVTFIAWINATSTAQTYSIIIGQNSGDHYYFGLHLDELLFGWQYGIFWSDHHTTNSNLATNTLYYVAVSYDGEKKCFYVNKSLRNSFDETLNIGISPGTIEIGKITPSTYFTGTIYEIWIFNKTLTPAEISQIHDNTHYTTGNLVSIAKDAEEIGVSGDVWKQISCNVDIPPTTNVDIYARTSFDNGMSDSWTDWTLIQANAGSEIIYDLPLENRERYGQWKLELETTDASLTPVIQNVNFISGSIAVKKENEKVSLSPNPFTPTHPPYDKVYFNIDNPQGKSVKLEIYSIKGRLISQKNFAPSETIYWDGKNNDGEITEDGGYIYQLKIGNKNYTGTLVLAK
ncbi:hypothetical protein KAU39_03480, partial [bacterium]|nr:hypothetical protein [bacterium]